MGVSTNYKIPVLVEVASLTGVLLGNYQPKKDFTRLDQLVEDDKGFPLIYAIHVDKTDKAKVEGRYVWAKHITYHEIPFNHEAIAAVEQATDQVKDDPKLQSELIEFLQKYWVRTS